MPVEIDVYREWLGIKEPARPLDYYQLLRLKRFEDDPARVREHYRKMNAHVRKFASGDHARQSQQLLNELARAMLCLTDARRKAEYDASLGRDDAGEGRRRSLEELLLGRKVLDAAQLDRARNYAKAVGVDLRDAVVQQKLAAADVVAQIHAESLGLAYVDLAEVGVDESFVPKVPALLARQNSFVPVMVDDGQLLLACPVPLAPNVEEELRLRTGLPVRSVLCTASGVNTAIGKYFPKEAAAAEMASRGAGQANATSPEAAAAKPAEPVDPAAQRKQKTNAAILTFNFTFIGYIIVGWQVLGWPFLPAFLIAGSAAATAFVLAGRG